MQDSDGSGTILQHLANERTYLAWIRYSIGILGLALVISYVKGPSTLRSYHYLRTASELILIILAIATDIHATLSFLKRTSQIKNASGNYPAGSASYFQCVAVLFAIVFVASLSLRFLR